MQTLDERAVARKPRLPKTIARLNGILDEAEKIILELGLEGFSIPILAARLNYTRASIYRFYPTPHAILNELSLRYFDESAEKVATLAAEHMDLPWRELVGKLVGFITDYYNSKPITRILLLGGAVTDKTFRIQEITNQRLGGALRLLLEARGLSVPVEPDVAWLAVDISDTIMRHSNYRHGRITEAYRDEVIRATLGYLETYIKD